MSSRRQRDLPDPWGDELTLRQLALREQSRRRANASDAPAASNSQQDSRLQAGSSALPWQRTNSVPTPSEPLSIRPHTEYNRFTHLHQTPLSISVNSGHNPSLDQSLQHQASDLNWPNLTASIQKAAIDYPRPIATNHTLTFQSEGIDPDPSVYIDSLKNVHGGPFAYCTGRDFVPTMLVMKLEKLDGETYRFATSCIHYRQHDVKSWVAFNRSDGVCSPRDQPSEREKCFMSELDIEKRLPSPEDLKRVWKNSCNVACSEQSSRIGSASSPPKDDMTSWAVAKHAYQLTAGYMGYHLNTVNPESQIALIGLSKSAETFQKLSSLDRVSVADSLIFAPSLNAKQIASLTNDWPVTISVPNLIVGSVNLKHA